MGTEASDDMYSNLKRKTLKTKVKAEVKTEQKVFDNLNGPTNNITNYDLERKLAQMKKEHAKMEAKIKTQERALEFKNSNIENLKMDLMTTKKELCSRESKLRSDNNNSIDDLELPDRLCKISNAKKLRDYSIEITPVYSSTNLEMENVKTNDPNGKFKEGVPSVFNSNSTDEEKITGYEKEKEEFRHKIMNLQNENTTLKTTNMML